MAERICTCFVIKTTSVRIGFAALMSKPSYLITCKHCNKQKATNWPSQIYCENRCQKEFQWNERKKLIVSTNSCTNPVQARRFLVETKGHQCEICGVTEWRQQPVALVCDHINGNSNDCSLNNLRMICPNCDAQTLTYKGKNRGNGRFYRRQRYGEGKSY